MKPFVLAAVVAAGAAIAAAQAGDQPVRNPDTQRADARLDALHREADRLAGEARTLLNELRTREIGRLIATEELHRATEDVAAAAADLAQLDVELQRVAAEVDTQLPALRRRLIDLYKLGEGRYLRLLLSTADARHAGQASRTVAMLAYTDRLRVEERRRQLDVLKATRERLVARQAHVEAARAEALRAQAAAQRAVQEQSVLLRRIDQRRDLTAQLAGELQIAQQNLQITLQAMARGEAVIPPILPIAPFQGDLVWPVEGRVRRRYAGATGANPLSSGIEIEAAEGTAVHAVHGGTVSFADAFAGFGNLVIIEHDARNFSLYGHLLDILVVRGARLESGAEVGSVGRSPGGAAGLYFELRIDARPVDPLQWLRVR
jgi:septal ring factor EnvC (AmiA/AmiB activator)